MFRPCRILFIAMAALLAAGAGTQGKPAPEVKPEQTKPGAAEPKSKQAPNPPAYEGTMTLEQMGVIIKRLDAKAEEPRKGYWRFAIEKSPVVIITDARHDRMRILVPIGKAEALSTAQLTRMMQANFDTALTAVTPSPRACCGRPSSTRCAPCTTASSSPPSARP